MAHPVVHFEIGCRDSQATQNFYKDLFGWKLEAFGPAAMIDTGVKDGIQGHINSLGHEPHQYVTIYILVEDIDAHLTRIGSHGGKTVVPKQVIPGMGEFAWFTDPGGNVIGLWKAYPRS